MTEVFWERALNNNQPKVNTRMLALNALLRIEKGEFSHVVLREILDANSHISRIDRAFVKRLVTGTESGRLQLDYILKQFILKDLCKLKPAILQILRMGVYQLLYMDSVPDNAACNESVKLAEKKGLGGLKGFVNGVLRNIARNKDKALSFENIKDKKIYLSVKYSTPEWLVDMWLNEYGEAVTEDMLAAFMEESVLTVRVNTSVISVEACKEALRAEAVEFEVHPYIEEALIIKNADNISVLNSFKEGFFQIQDVSSMLVGVAADYKKGDKVLDICAAPGGKSMHAASLVGKEGQVISNDLTEKKVQLIRENAKRQRLYNIVTTVSDACIFKPEYEEMFEVVIADVPCSGLGVIGRKSDIKYRIVREDIDSLVELQRKILSNAVRYVKKGGTLMFSTCTVNKSENDSNLKWLEENFELKRKGFSELFNEPLRSECTANEGYLQMLPGKHKTDGFFLAKLCKE